MTKCGLYYEYVVFFDGGVYPGGDIWQGFVYKIFQQSTKELVRESGEWFDTAAQAGFAAVGHIDLLENGEG